MKFIRIILLTIIMLFATGCWGQKEMDQVGIITVTGFDLEPDGLFRVTVHSIQPFGSRMIPADRSFTWIGTATGKSIVDATRNLKFTATKELIWLHSKLVIVGEEMARHEFDKVLDFLSRNRQIRYNSNLLVMEGRALDLLQVPADIERNLTTELEGIINNSVSCSTYISDIKEFLIAASSDCPCIVTAKIGYFISNMDSFSTSKEEYRKFNPDNDYLGRVFIEGGAVFKGQELVGWLNNLETHGLMWIKGKIRTGVVTSGMLRDENGAAMETIKTRTNIKCIFSDGRPTIKINTEVVGRLI